MCTHTPLHLSQNEVDSTLTKHKRVLGKITLVSFRCLGKASLFKKKKKKNALRECDQMSYCANAATEKRQGEREREREKRKKKPKSYAFSII